MPGYCEEQYIYSLEKKIKEQEAMIDWLIDEVRDWEDAPVRTRKEIRELARKAAWEAVKKS